MSKTVHLTHEIRIRLRQCVPSMATVLDNDDLVALILQHAELTPEGFVIASRVCRAWHTSCMRDGGLVLKAARQANYLTKRALMGLLALSSGEADRLPRNSKRRRDGGIMFKYHKGAVDRAWRDVVGGVGAWQTRLAERSRTQKGIEEVFGPDWRVLRWSKQGQGLRWADVGYGSYTRGGSSAVCV